MIATLRNLVRQWANERMVRANETLRQQLIRAEATVDRQTQAMRSGERALNVATKELAECTATIDELRKELATKAEQIERQADLFDEYRTEIAALRRCIADADNTAARESAKDPDARPRCPEGLLVDGSILYRCVRDGGHDGNHWSRDREREWEPVPVDENVVPPW